MRSASSLAPAPHRPLDLSKRPQYPQAFRMIAVALGVRQSRKADRSCAGPGLPVRRHTAHSTSAGAALSSQTPDRRIGIDSASVSGPMRTPTPQLTSPLRLGRAGAATTPGHGVAGHRSGRAAPSRGRAARNAGHCLPLLAENRGLARFVLCPGGRSSAPLDRRGQKPQIVFGCLLDHFDTSERIPEIIMQGGCLRLHMCKLGFASTLPEGILGCDHTICTACTCDDPLELSDHFKLAETKGSLVNSPTERALASVYDRSFTDDIPNCNVGPLPHFPDPLRPCVDQGSAHTAQVAGSEIRSLPRSYEE
jgi:hypothetical protein